MPDINERKALLQNSRLFRDFSPAVIETIVPLLTTVSYKADSLICLKGDDSDSLYIVRDGDVEISVSSSDGKIILLGVLSGGDVFGEVGLLDKQSRTANVSAKTDVSLYRLGSSDFDKVSQKFSVKEWMALTSYICFLFRNVTNNLEETVFLDAGVRIARKIQTLYAQSGGEGVKDNTFTISISQETLGRMAGLSREATNKALAALEKRELIEHKYKKIIVSDLKKFLAMVDEQAM